MLSFINIHSPLALRARFSGIISNVHGDTQMKRASEASGLSTGCGKVSASVAMLQSVKIQTKQLYSVLTVLY